MFRRFFLEDIDVSIILPCKDEGAHLKGTVDGMLQAKTNLTVEIIVVNDNSKDGCYNFLLEDKEEYKRVRLLTASNLGIAGARNIGASIARGKYLFFFDAHIYVEDFWMDKLINTLEDNCADAITPTMKDMSGNVVGYGGTWNQYLTFTYLEKPDKNGAEVPLSPGGAFVIKRKVFEDVNGFDSHYGPWGYEDQEMSLKLWLFGYKIVVDTEVSVRHYFKEEHNYEIDYSSIIYNYIWMIYSHFTPPNIEKALWRFSTDPLFSPPTAAVLLDEELLKQRRKYFDRRVITDQDFLDKFHIIF